MFSSCGDRSGYISNTTLTRPLHHIYILFIFLVVVIVLLFLIRVDQNKILALSLEVFETNGEQFHRVRELSSYKCGVCTDLHFRF